jgi:SAM-dependent methyltransferase
MMWQLQMVKRLVKSAVPFQDDVRRIKRRLMPYSDTLDNGSMALSVGLHQIRLLREAGADLTGDVLELGTGWLPIVALLFHLAGARHLVLTDIRRLMDERTVARARTLVAAHLPEIAREFAASPAELRARLEEPLSYSYFVPWRAARQSDCSLDVIVSRTVLEHIPPDVLEDYMLQFRRVLRPGGVMCHNVDNSDHWEHQDKSIGRLNFLRYEDGPLWRLASVSAYQNRLRHSDYAAMFDRTGWVTILADGPADEQCLRDLETLPLAARFRDRDPRDLAALSSNFILRKATA